MRDIKFRAWDAKEKQMLEVNHLFNLDNKQPIEVWTNYCEGGYRFNPDKSELMQYTGLDDVNDVEIYERDFLWDSNGKLIGAVKFDEGTFIVGEDNLYDWYYESEVIGNEFDNPELLEDK